jgi:hypothetical protein
MRLIPAVRVCSSWEIFQTVNATWGNMTVVVYIIIGTGGRLDCGSAACIKPINLRHSARFWLRSFSEAGVAFWWGGCRRVVPVVGCDGDAWRAHIPLPISEASLARHTVHGSTLSRIKLLHSLPNFIFRWPCISIHPYNENQLYVLFILSLFRQPGQQAVN